MPTPSKRKKKAANSVPRFRKSMQRNVLTNIRFDQGLRGIDIADAADVRVELVHKLERGAKGKGSKQGKVARNHPAVPALATAYGVTVAQLAPFLGPASQYFGATKAKAKAKAETPDTIAPGKRVALVVAKPTKVAKATKPSTPATKRAYNKLTRVPLPVREFVRGLVTDVNVRIMQGETEMILAPMPMPLVRDFLGEYLKAKGIDATGLLLDPAFAKQFG
jgi:hypothetical protein